MCVGLQRCGKSCRLRWTNYLRPDIKRGKFSLQEEQTIIQLHALLGNRYKSRFFLVMTLMISFSTSVINTFSEESGAGFLNFFSSNLHCFQ